MKQQFIDQGFLIRPLGNTVYLMPPYCIDLDQLSSAYEAMRRVLDGLLV
jgi:adenosylmethionine-8-amino-7-oxononanoate aminotransferase